MVMFLNDNNQRYHDEDDAKLKNSWSSNFNASLSYIWIGTSQGIEVRSKDAMEFKQSPSEVLGSVK